jgi:hypothetical protein
MRGPKRPGLSGPFGTISGLVFTIPLTKPQRGRNQAGQAGSMHLVGILAGLDGHHPAERSAWRYWPCGRGFRGQNAGPTLGPWIELRIQLRRRKKPRLQEHFCGRKVAILRLLYKEEEML